MSDKYRRRSVVVRWFSWKIPPKNGQFRYNPYNSIGNIKKTYLWNDLTLSFSKSVNLRKVVVFNAFFANFGVRNAIDQNLVKPQVKSFWRLGLSQPLHWSGTRKTFWSSETTVERKKLRNFILGPLMPKKTPERTIFVGDSLRLFVLHFLRDSEDQKV